MLKGQMDIDIEFSAGTIIFIAILLLLLTLAVAPLIAFSINTATSSDELRSMEYANLAAGRLAAFAGTGTETEYLKMSSMSAKGPQSLGLSDNFMKLSTIPSGGTWVFDGKKGRVEHTVYLTMKSPIMPVLDKKQTILESGRDYVIHAYRLDEHNMAVDIYSSYTCSDTAAVNGNYRPVACSSLSVLQNQLMGADDIKKQIVTPVFNGEDDILAWIEPEAGISAKEILPESGLKRIVTETFSGSWECDSTRGKKVCIRFAGDFAVPLKLDIDMETRAEYTSGLDYGGGSFGGSGSGSEWSDAAGIEVTPADRTPADVLSAIHHANTIGLIINRRCSCGTSCSDYASWIVEYSKEYGIPDPLLPLSIMMQESSCTQEPSQGSLCNAYGYCGLMQISKSVSGYDDPETNIREGIKLLREKYDTYKNGHSAEGCFRTLQYSGWKAAVRGYVGWGCPDTDNDNVKREHDNYVEMVMLRYGELRKALSG